MKPELSPDIVRNPAVNGQCEQVGHYAADGWKSRAALSSPKRPSGLTPKPGLNGTFVVHKVGDGMLVGTNRGEFGGDLRWLSHGREELVADGNVFAVIQRPWGLLAVQATSGNGWPRGTISTLERAPEGSWRATPWLELTGAPRALRLDHEAALEIATTSGTISLARSGSVERFDCHELRRP
jgi:hypothetical protein